MPPTEEQVTDLIRALLEMVNSNLYATPDWILKLLADLGIHRCNYISCPHLKH